MERMVIVTTILLLLFTTGLSAQRKKSTPSSGIAPGEMPALDFRDLQEFRRKPGKWWLTNMGQSLYLSFGRQRRVDLLHIVTREDAYNVADLGLIIRASEEVKDILEDIPLLSDDKIENWEVSDLDIPVAERVVKGIGVRMEVFRMQFGPLWGTIRVHNGMHGERLTLKEVFGARTTEGLVTIASKLTTGQRGYPLGGDVIVGVDLLQVIFGGRKFRIETPGNNPWSFSVATEIGYGVATDLSNVYKLPQDWSLIEEIIEQSIVELTPWDSQVERDLAKVATDIIIGDISVPKSLTSTVFDTNLNLLIKKNLPPRKLGNATRYRQIGLSGSLGRSFYQPNIEGTPGYSLTHMGLGIYWSTFF